MIMHVHNETARLLANNATSPPAGTTPADWKYDLGFYIISFVFLIPCMLAACAQSVYCVKKRRQNRIEQQLLAVSTNPTSRMLVLSEFFKNDSRVSAVLIATIAYSQYGILLMICKFAACHRRRSLREEEETRLGEETSQEDSIRASGKAG